MDLTEVGCVLPYPSIQESYSNFQEFLSWAEVQVFNKKSDYAAFAWAFGLYKTVARAQLEMRPTRTLQRGGQHKGRGRIAREPPICVPKENLVPTSANSAEKNRLKFSSDIRATYSKYFQFSEGLVSPLSSWKGELHLNEDSETCLLLPEALRNLNAFVNLFPYWSPSKCCFEETVLKNRSQPPCLSAQYQS